MANRDGIKNHVIICGYGLVGEMVADILAQHDIPFVVIENDPSKIDRLSKAEVKAIHGDATLARSLREANISGAKAIAIVMDDDAKNLFCVITAKSLNSKIVIVTRANETDIKGKMRDAGAQFVATPNQSVVDELFGELVKEQGK